MRPTIRKSILFCMLICLGLACRLAGLPGTSAGTLTPTQNPSPRPSATATPPPATLIPFTPAPLTPSPEPRVYIVRKGDTLSVIAYNIGLKVEDILAANPGLDAAFITPGQQIVIPVLAGGKLVMPQPTLVPVHMDMPECYPTADGGLRCIAAVYNGSADYVEGLRALFTLHGADGTPLKSLPAILPLERLAPGKTLPVVTFFAPPVDEVKGISLDLLNALSGRTAEARFVDISIQVSETMIEKDGNQAVVKGQVALTGAGQNASKIKIVATGYSKDGRALGTRTWENTQPLTGAQSLPFSITVFSLDGPFENVDVQGEVKP